MRSLNSLRTICYCIIDGKEYIYDAMSKSPDSYKSWAVCIGKGHISRIYYYYEQEWCKDFEGEESYFYMRKERYKQFFEEPKPKDNILFLSPRMYNLLKEKAGCEPMELNINGMIIPVHEDTSLDGNSLQAYGDLAEMLNKVFIEAFIKIK